MTKTNFDLKLRVYHLEEALKRYQSGAGGADVKQVGTISRCQFGVRLC
jgi:hypothetical protein